MITFGYNRNSDYYATDIQFRDGMPVFHLHHNGTDYGEIALSIPGEHNILNAAASFACCHQLGVEPAVIIETLERFTGIQRRFDVKGVFGNGVKLVDDDAHHPTEVKATLEAARNIPHNKLWCVFQPHTYTRTLALFDQFADAFQAADKIILADIYAAREKDIYNVDSGKLADAIKTEHPEKDVRYMADFAEIADYIRNNASKGDLVLTMGAGDVYKVGNMIMDGE